MKQNKYNLISKDIVYKKDNKFKLDLNINFLKQFKIMFMFMFFIGKNIELI